jgi:tRNA 2-selenouridine synthase
MSRRLSAEEFLQEAQYRTVLDVRTPAEYIQGHIPGAKNLPLFDDEERAIVGTIYKQENPEAAFRRGLEIAGNRMNWYLDEARRFAPDLRVAVHCWRGGKRSESIAWLLGMAGFEVVTLQGGYKYFRRLVLETFERVQLPLLVVGGRTGSGKTEILQCLAAIGEQVIDLEELAQHKGSAFGSLGEEPQPTSEHFENRLFAAIRALDHSSRIWIENESRNIGKVFLPDGFWEQKASARLFHLDVPAALRLQRSIAEYGKYPQEELIASFDRIKKRLGGQHHKRALEAMESGDLDTAASIALSYYDKGYDHCVTTGSFSEIIEIEVMVDNPAETARNLVTFADTRGF